MKAFGSSSRCQRKEVHSRSIASKGIDHSGLYRYWHGYTSRYKD